MNNTTHKGGKCLTNEELAIEIQNGKTEYLPVLWEQIEGFVKWKANQCFQKLLDNPDISLSIEFDDLYDSGYFAMLKAVKYFKPETEYKFLTFLDLPLKTVFNEVISGRMGATHLHKRDPLNHSISLDTPIGDDEEQTLGNILADETDIAAEVIEGIVQQELHNDLETALKTLEPTEEKVIRLYYYHGLNVPRIGEELNITGTQVQAIKVSALRKLRKPVIRRLLEKHIDAHTNFYLRVGAKSQKSPVELIVLRRERLRNKELSLNNIQVGPHG
jgi:RNA polymerase sigma factor (sigma-70 family)